MGSRFWGVSGQARSVAQACFLKRSPSFWRESLLVAVNQRFTLKNLKQRLIYVLLTTIHDDDDDKTTTGGVPSSYNDDWGRQRRRFIPLVRKLGQAYNKKTLIILDLMTLNIDDLPPSNDALRC